MSVRTREYYLANPVVGLGAGFFDGLNHQHKFGHNGAVGTSLETLWGEGGIYVYPAAATIMQVSSSDVDDDDGDTGAQTINILGMDSNYVEQTEDIILNGQSQVATVNSYLRVYRMKVLTTGASLWNEGTIYIGTGAPTSGKPSTVYGLIEPFQNQTLMALYTIPDGFRGYVVQTLFTSSIAKQVACGLYARPEGGVFNIQEYTSLISGDVRMPHMTSSVCDPHTDIEARAVASGGGGDVACQFEVVLVRLP